ncbi:hypothetical protein K458DRAFT_322434 [Lentithecium fluviatile CBS 122367]|uniref:Tat pathway signal sequence n=1 Tax=Lentithecium fluviatile CBS 122367 TaxID=1168545 RepID=A0A6G1IDJ0_9PLEO|nr:hypothetical protein K458DRAFT_322434 [Lentithecium fluviatile CBS 122367]
MRNMFTRLFSRRNAAKAPPRDAEDSETLLPTSSSVSGPASRPKQSRRSRDLEIVVRTLLVSTAVYVTASIWIAFSIRGESFVEDPDMFCMNHISQYSPIVNEVKPGWHTVQFNGTFLHENIYRQDVGPDVDAAWEALGTEYRSVVIPAEEAEKTGLRLDQVKVAQVYGGGYPANVEGLHHLHCLNLLRKTLKWNYDYYEKQGKDAFVNSEDIVRYHVTHCLDILRQQLMCVTDVGVLGQVWWQPADEPNPMPFVDFNTKHRCRDFEAIRRWAEVHQLPPEETVDTSTFYQMPKPGDTVYSEIP